MNKILLDIGWKKTLTKQHLFSSKLSKLHLSGTYNCSILALTIKNINKSNEIDIYSNNSFIFKLRLAPREEKTLRIDINKHKSSTIDFMSKETLDIKGGSTLSFEVKKILLDGNRIHIANIEYKRNIKLENLINSFTYDFSGGVGDFMRGSIFLYKYCKQNNIKFNLDLKHHGISEYFNNLNESSEEYAKSDVLDITRMCGHKYTSMLDLMGRLLTSDKKTRIISSNYTNMLEENSNEDYLKKVEELNLKEDEQDFFHKTFNFSKDINRKYLLWLKSNNIKKEDLYGVVHVRAGDTNFITSNDIAHEYCTNTNIDPDYIYEEILKFQKDLGHKIIFLSDSDKLKQIIREKGDTNIIVSSSIPTHCVSSPGIFQYVNKVKFEETDFRLEEMVLDMKILSKSKKTKIFSVYNWGSGFSMWLSKIFNIPTSIHYIEPTENPIAMDKKNIIPYGHSPGQYSLDLKYNKNNTSLLDYFNRLLNAMFIVDQYGVKIHSKDLPDFIESKRSTVYVPFSQLLIKESSGFTRLKSFCEQCSIVEKNPLFMRKVISYNDHFCKDINLHKKRYIFKNYIHNTLSFDTDIPTHENDLIVLLSESDIKNIQIEKNKIKRLPYENIIFLIDNQNIANKFDNEMCELPNKNTKQLLLKDNFSCILTSRNIAVFDKKYISLLPSINLNLKNLYVPGSLLKEANSFNIRSFSIETHTIG